MRRFPRATGPASDEPDLDRFMDLLEDDTEDAPWMTMGDLQFWSASSLAHSLRIYAHEKGLPWYLASMMPILYRWKSERKHQLAPDLFVAFVPEHSRLSFDVPVEGAFPSFVLEVVSPSSTRRDQFEKRRAYEALDVQEYLLFTPRAGEPSTLQGYRRNAQGRFEPWPMDIRGRLWSDVLDLGFFVREEQVQAEAREGRLILTPDQLAEARRAEQELRLSEAEARRRAEEEVERLRREIERLRSEK